MLNFRKMLRTWINDPKRLFVTQFYIEIIRSYHQHIRWTHWICSRVPIMMQDR